VQERRASRRYKLALQVEIRIESNLKEFEPILGRTCDISTLGFYFRIGQSLRVGMKFGFSIMPAGKIRNIAMRLSEGGLEWCAWKKFQIVVLIVWASAL
jgi:hypothetical protein